MSYALRKGSDSSSTRILMNPSEVLQTTTVVRIPNDTVSGLIWPDSTTVESRQHMAARIKYLEEQLEEAQHAELVRRASVGSSAAWHAFFDDDEDD